MSAAITDKCSQTGARCRTEVRLGFDGTVSSRFQAKPHSCHSSLCNSSLSAQHVCTGISVFIYRPTANIHLTAFCNNVDHAWIMAEKYHLKLVLNWFGHYASGDGTIYPNLTGELFVPMYIARDEKTYPRAVDAVDADAPAADSGTNPAPGGSSSCIGGHLTAKSQTGQLAHLVQIR